MSVSSSTSQVEVQLFRHQIERDYSIQCEDVSELLSVAQFKQRCRDLSEELTTHVIRDESEADLEIAGACNTASLLPPGGLEPFLKGKKPGFENTQLQCLNHIDIQRDYFERKGLPLHSSGSILSYHAAPKGTSGGRESSAVATVDHSEVILCAFIYHPIKRRRDVKVLLLGCQLLTDLRDKVPCFRDYIVDQDCSEDPSAFDHQSLVTGVPPNRSKSAFFFIDNTFYNDYRYEGCTDLSVPILKWIHDTCYVKSARLDNFHTADMATTRLDQLSLRLGYPYLFCHHQTCQHLVIFTDLRLIHHTDCQKVTDYPRVFPLHFGKRKLCFVCNVFSPVWVTLEDMLAPETPCLFCEDCFKKLHYSTDGEKMCSFKAYPYNPTMLL